jgi:Domain of unknown function (DUF4037)
VDTALRIARQIVPAYRALGGLSFAYGQGSVFTGFTSDSDVDIVLVWDRDGPPASSERPVEKLHTGRGVPVTFHQPGFVLDRLDIGGVEVDVSHKTRRVFDGWVGDVRSGRGWEGVEYPTPLYAIAGFAYGTLLADGAGTGSEVRSQLSIFPPALVERSRTLLAEELPSYDRDLATCARRGDGWLFHDLLSKVMRHALVTWFAAERRYCPHPKWLHQWVARFGMDPAIAGLERGLWAPPVSLARRRELFLAMAERILQLRAGRAGAAADRPR